MINGGVWVVRCVTREDILCRSTVVSRGIVVVVIIAVIVVIIGG